MAASITRKLHEGVGKARGVLLLQTNRVFSDPLSLLEVYWATRKQLPIVCLRLEGSDYDFEKVRTSSWRTSRPTCTPIAPRRQSRRRVARCAHDLLLARRHYARRGDTQHSHPPIRLLADVSENHLAATVEDIRERLQHELAHCRSGESGE